MSAAAQIHHSHSAGSYITFSAGDADYALSVEHVRYITELNTLSTRLSPKRDGSPPQKMVDYAGKAIALHRFCEIIGANSQIDESAALIELLKARRQDHINWMQALEHSIRSGEAFTKATDPHKCAFGLWYDKYEPQDSELRDIMAKFDAPHKRIHALAEALLQLAEKPEKIDEAIHRLNAERSSTLRELLALFNQASTRLDDMVKPVVLVLEDQGHTFALEIECIGDILNFEESNWLPDQAGSAHASACYDGFFQTSESAELFLNIVPSLLLPTMDTNSTLGCANNTKPA